MDFVRATRWLYRVEHVRVQNRICIGYYVFGVVGQSWQGRREDVMKLVMPWNNLGCLAIRTRDRYIDVFVSPYFGVYNLKISTGERTWRRLPTFRLLRRQVC